MSLSNKIAKSISKEMNMDTETQEVINYGAAALMQVVVSLAFVSLFGLLFGRLWEALTVSFTISILRQFSGGAHSSKPSICVIIGTTVTVLLALLPSLIVGYLNEISVIFIGTLIFIWAYYTICEKAPVDSAAKPITTEKKRAKMRRMSLIVLSVYILLSVISFYVYFLSKEEHRHFLIYLLCIYGGVLWQTFTLTITGHKILGKVDKFLTYLLFRKEG